MDSGSGAKRRGNLVVDERSEVCCLATLGGEVE
jgi:hypothetical protein